MIGTTTGSIAVVSVGILKVFTAILEGAEDLEVEIVEVEEDEEDEDETTTLKPHGTLIPAGRDLGRVIVLVGVQLEETTKLIPQGVENWLGRLIGTVMVVVGVQIDEEEEEEVFVVSANELVVEFETELVLVSVVILFAIELSIEDAAAKLIPQGGVMLVGRL